MQVCAKCGEQNSDRAHFCQACASPLAKDTRPPTDVRKTVTVLFCDVTGSTSMGEHFDPELLRRVMSHYFDDMRAVVERHGGTVEKFIGDAVMAVFGIPQLHEDDSMRAVRAAFEMHEALSKLNGELDRDHGMRLQARIGVNTGEAVAGDASQGHTFVTGDAVNIAARLEQTAAPGEIVLGETTYKLVQHAITAEPNEPLALKGKAELVPAFRLIAVTPIESAVGRGHETPMVGREREVSRLQDAFDRVVMERTCVLVTVIGMPGVGKSRLANELVTSLEGSATVLRGRCLPYGEAITFWPVWEVVRQAAGIRESHSANEVGSLIEALLPENEQQAAIREGVAAAIGLGSATGSIHDTFWAIRRFLETLAQDQPLVLVFDDIQWAEPTFLDLVEYLADVTVDAPILFLCMARPDLLDARPSWRTRTPDTTIALDVLSGPESEVLLDHLLSDADLTPDVAARIAQIAGGNPLFLKEVFSMMVEEGLLRREDDRWVLITDLSSVPVPASIDALMSARLDRLDVEERELMERASVIGEVFYWGAVAALTPEGSRPGIGAHLVALVGRDLIRPERSDQARDDAFRFRHLLLREAAYRRIPKAGRTQLHQRVAEWLEQAAGERPPAWEEIAGFHLEQAYRYQVEVGSTGERTQILARSAGELLGTAGERALAIGTPSAAAVLLDRAVALLPDGNARRGWLLEELQTALSDLGERDRASALDDEILRSAKALNDRGLMQLVALNRAMAVLDSNAKTVSIAEIRREVDRAVAVFEKLGDQRSLSYALTRLAQTHWMAGHLGEALAPAERALEQARRAGESVEATFAAEVIAELMEEGPTPVPIALERTVRLLADVGWSLAGKAELLAQIALLQTMRGDLTEGRSSAAKAARFVKDLGEEWVAMDCTWTFGKIEHLTGEVPKAEPKLRAAWDYYRSQGLTARQMEIAWDLAQVVYQARRHDEVAEIAEIVRSEASPNDVWAQITWRSLAAKVEARAGKYEAAENHSREARELADQSDFLNLRADLAMDRAEILQLAGRPAAALSAVDEAIELYERKGNLLAVSKARAQHKHLASNTSPTP